MDIQNEICNILTKYGVKEIYDAETEILHVVGHAYPLDTIRAILKECAEFVKTYVVIVHPEDGERRIISYLDDALKMLEEK